MRSKAVCPECSREISDATRLNAWTFGDYKVQRLRCSGCKSKFNVYSSAKRTFTIPKSK